MTQKMTKEAKMANSMFFLLSTKQCYSQTKKEENQKKVCNKNWQASDDVTTPTSCAIIFGGLKIRVLLNYKRREKRLW